MEEKYEVRKSQFKNAAGTGIEARKTLAKKDSDEARQALLAALRYHYEESSGLVPQNDPRKSDALQLRNLFVNAFMYPDTMIEIPANLERDWLVLLRPEGERCIAILKNNRLTLRSRAGSKLMDEIVLDPFSLRMSDTVSIFDAVLGFSQKTMQKTLFVIDVLEMKKNELVFSDFEFRQFFLKQHWPFHPPSSSAPMLGLGECGIDIQLLPAMPVNRSSLQSLYENEENAFQSDSLLFYLKAEKYTPGLTQNVLIFRDEHLSRFAIDTRLPDGFDGEEPLQVVLRAVWDKTTGVVALKTWDGKALVVDEHAFEDGKRVIPAWIGERVRKYKFTLVKVTYNTKMEPVDYAVSGKPFASSYRRLVDQFRKRRAVLRLPETGNLDFDAPALLYSDIVQALSS